MPKIWGRRSAFNVQKVLWFADELQLVYEHISAGGEFGGLDRPEFLALNPHGRIPVIEDDGNAIWESHAILRYFAARYGGERFWPTEALARSQADGWMDWAQTTLQPDFLTGVFWNYYRTPDAQKNWPSIHEKIAACASHFKLLDRWLENRDFMLGDALSLADIPIGVHLYRYYELDIERPDLPGVEAWYRKLAERPAYRKNIMIPFTEMQGNLQY